MYNQSSYGEWEEIFEDIIAKNDKLVIAKSSMNPQHKKYWEKWHQSTLQSNWSKPWKKSLKYLRKRKTERERERNLDKNDSIFLSETMEVRDRRVTSL